jgi:hypothetical protein
VNCLLVRDLLPEHAIGVLDPDDASSVERHLEWCAACRKEAGELQRAAATLAFSVAPVDPPAELEDRVVETLRGAARRRGGAGPRLRSRGVAFVLAAALALGAVGWGAVLAGRNARLETQVAAAQQRQRLAFQRFQKVLDDPQFRDPANVVELADLMSPRQRLGSGDALVYLSPSSDIDDVALVAFTGLTGLAERRLPIEVWLVSDAVPDVLVGRIHALNTDGGGGVRRWYLDSLRPFDRVVVRDARGTVLLSGSLTVYEPTP